MKLIILSLVVLTVAIGCASKHDPTKEFDKELKSGTTDDKEKVGLKDDKVYIKKKIFLEEQLFKLKREAEDLENAVYGRSKQDPGGIFAALKDCRKNLSDPRLGGSGIPEKMEKWEKITETEDDYTFMVDKHNNVVGVTEEELGARVTRLKRNKRLLNDTYDRFTDKLTVCQSKYRSALVQHGLNPTDTKAQGEWVEGPDGYKVWKMKEGATKDPEELMKRKYKRAKGK